MARNVHAPQSALDLPLFALAQIGATAALPVHHGGLRQPSRDSDPETSHEAARELRASGRLTDQCADTLQQLVRYEFRVGQAPTSFELAGDDLQARYQHARRLPDLEALGFVVRLDSKRPCSRSGRSAFPWRVTESGMRVFREMQAARRRQEVR